MKTYTVDTNAERLLIYLKQYLGSAFLLIYENTNFHIEATFLNDLMPVSQKDPSTYPVLLFYAYSDIEYAIHALHQLTNHPGQASKPIGSLVIVDARYDQSFLQFQMTNYLFHKVEEEIIEEITKFWRPELIRETQDVKAEPTKSSEVIFDDPKKIGKYIRTFEFPRKIQPVEELSATDNQNPADLPYDKLLVQLWNEGIKSDQICRTIREQRLGSIKVERMRNRISELRRLHPDWKISTRRNFKKK